MHYANDKLHLSNGAIGHSIYYISMTYNAEMEAESKPPIEYFTIFCSGMYQCCTLTFSPHCWTFCFQLNDLSISIKALVHILSGIIKSEWTPASFTSPNGATASFLAVRHFLTERYQHLLTQRWVRRFRKTFIVTSTAVQLQDAAFSFFICWNFIMRSNQTCDVFFVKSCSTGNVSKSRGSGQDHNLHKQVLLKTETVVQCLRKHIWKWKQPFFPYFPVFQV